MKGVDTVARIRREFFVRGRTIKEIVRELHVSRNTVRKVLRSNETAFDYERSVQPMPRLGVFKPELDRMLATNDARSVRERLTLTRAYADRIEIRQDGRVVAEHARCFGCDQTIYDPWHYVPVLARKPGALRNGAPFEDWVLPTGLERVRRKLGTASDGGRQMVDILTAVLRDGLPAVEAACSEALSEGVHSADVILDILARAREPARPVTIMTPDALRLRDEPAADCARYDNLRRAL